MTDQQQTPPTPLVGTELELARLRAGLTAGLTVEQSARLQGADEAALTADATAFAAELSAANPAPQGPRSGGDRGGDVQGTAGTVSAGVAEYRRKHGLDEDGNRPPVPQRVNTSRTANPYAERGYTTEHR
ncbi:hypothetical protein [Streptomyces sp. NBC_00236]|uniref:hypothetical protein n=1 Tax=Streptomyces sp. NBC_00236 TaxID=2903639 RepID=UPI002E2BBBBC|nr:hypothetical protein [Streptomyces sp. NBC_00236]